MECTGSIHRSAPIQRRYPTLWSGHTAKCHLPYSLIEKPEFRDLLKILAPRYVVPCRITLKTRICEQYESRFKLMKQTLKKVTALSLKTDIWTSSHTTQSFLGVTVHYLRDFNFESFAVGAVPLEERHTGENICAEFEKICDRWGIKGESIQAIVTDNAANMTKACREFFIGQGVPNSHVGCFAHTLHLIVYEGGLQKNEHLQTLLLQMKSIVAFYKHSVVASDLLRKKTPFKLIQSVPTPWNYSTYSMIERFMKISEHINEILYAMHATGKPPAMIAADMMASLTEVMEVLKPWADITAEMSAEKNVTVSKIIPIV